LRQQIDAIDSEILRLLIERVKLVLEVGELKRVQGLQVHDPERERQMLDQLSARATTPLDPPTLRRIFACVIDESRRLEQHHVANGGDGPETA
jgi:chorismate mutase